MLKRESDGREPEFLGDVRFAARRLWASPGFALAAVATLAIGIGVNTTMFSVVDGALLKPPPFSRPERIVTLFQDDRKKGTDHGAVAPANFLDWRARTRAFTALAAAEPFALDYSGPEGAEQIYNWNVTQDFFTVLDPRPAVGRLFHASDFAFGAERVLLLTYASWQQRFGADPGIAGRRVTIDGAPATIVGVLPANFAYLQSSKMEMFAPNIITPRTSQIRNTAWWNIVGRLKPGVTLEAARADANRVAAELSTEYPATNTQLGVTIERVGDTIAGGARHALLLLLGAVGMVLLIACTNVANLVLARTARRSGELAIRVALGASRGRLVRQLLTENLLVAAIGGACGTALAWVGISAIRALSPASLPRVNDIRVDARALAFTAGAVVLTTLLVGALPAVRATTIDAVQELKAGGRTAGSARQRRMGALFVTAEVALAVVLLVGSGLLVRSFIAVIHADRGYTSDHVLAATVFVYKWNKTPAARAQFIAQLVARATAIPGVVAAGATSSLPLEMAIDKDQDTFTIDGRPVHVGDEPSVHMTSVTPSAFDALHIPLRRGRGFNDADQAATTPVAIISEEMARRFWPGENAIGQHVTFAFDAPAATHEIVGIVADVRQTALDAPAEPILYVPHPQGPSGAMVIVLRTATEPRLMTRDLKRAVAELNPALPLAAIETFDDLVDASLRPRQFTLVLWISFAGCAVLLAIVGVYAVVSQNTADRWKELGVRVALGAQAADMIWMVMRQGLIPAGAGVLLGAAGGAVLSAGLRSMLYSIAPLDMTTFAAVAFVMLATAMLACYLPARRATAVDPLVALRAS